MKYFEVQKTTILLDMVLRLFRRKRITIEEIVSDYEISLPTFHRYISELRHSIYNLNLSCWIDIRYENGMYLLNIKT